MALESETSEFVSLKAPISLSIFLIFRTSHFAFPEMFLELPVLKDSWILSLSEDDFKFDRFSDLSASSLSAFPVEVAATKKT